MTRSSGKFEYQGKPHIGPSETQDAGCLFVVPKLQIAVAFADRKPAHFPVRSFAGKLVHLIILVRYDVVDPIWPNSKKHLPRVGIEWKRAV